MQYDDKLEATISYGESTTRRQCYGSSKVPIHSTEVKECGILKRENSSEPVHVECHQRPTKVALEAANSCCSSSVVDAVCCLETLPLSLYC